MTLNGATRMETKTSENLNDPVNRIRLLHHGGLIQIAGRDLRERDHE
jgi:hypothetical protein